MKRNDLVGETYGRLTVVKIHSLCKKKNVRWLCKCSCGGEAIAYAYDLRSGRVVSCGCRTREGLRVIHGMAREGKRRSKEYSIWAAMISRCTNKKDRNWEHYGGRGITVCDEWRRFEAFYKDMGAKPEGKSLDRIDNDKGYSPDNCEWRSIYQQSRNKRSTVWVVVDGETLILSDALKKVGCCIAKLHYRMNKYKINHQEALDLWRQQKKI